VPIVAGMGLAVKAASDLQESTSKVGVVFEENAKQIIKWSKDSAQAMGLSQQQALEATGTFGNLFRAMQVGTPESAKMSRSLVQLAADLASFNNADPSEVLEALRSGLVGEAEPLRRFGVSLSAARIEAKALEMGLASTKDELTAGAKAQAAYAIIMEDTKLAQGDFARTSEGLANQMRIAKAEFTNAAAELGVVLLPVVAKGVGLLADLAHTFSGLPSDVRTFILVLGGLAAALGPVLVVTGSLIKNYRMMSSAAPGAAKGLTAIGLAAGVATASFTLTTKALDAVSTQGDKAERISKAWEDYAKATQAAALATGNHLVPAFRAAARAFLETGDSATPLLAKFRAFKDILKENYDAGLNLAAEFKNHPKLYQLMQVELEKAAAKQKKHADALDVVTTSAEGQLDALKDLNDYIKAQADAQLGLEGASLRLDKSLADLYVTLKNNAAGSFEARGATLDAKGAIEDYGDAIKDQIGLLGDEKRANAERIWALGEVAGRLAPGSDLRVWLEEYIDRLRNGIPTDVTTTVKLNLPAAVAYNFDGSLDFDGNPLTPFARGGIVPGLQGSPRPILAHGGEVVLNKAQQRKLLEGGTGGGFTVEQINISTAEPRDAAAEVIRRLRVEAFFAGAN
jgi:hypothetical protein